jgi:D-alanine-D-alanine ligase
MPAQQQDLLKGLTLGVLYGGPSSEREVSIQSGRNVSLALSSAGHDVHQVLLDGSFTSKDAQALGIDAAFLAVHGEFGEDGRLQAILEDADIPYTGSGVDASSLAFDKVLAKRAFEKANLRTPVWMSFDISEVKRAATVTGMYLVPPLVVKPAAGGSSLGVSIVHKERQIIPAINKAFEFGDTVVVERFIQGRELTVGIVGGKALPIAELKVASEFYDYNAKYEDNRTRIVCPAELAPETAQKVQEAALAAHKALGCCDLSRTDIILDEAGLPWILEVNTLPGMTSHSLLPKAAAAAGITFTQLCEELLRLALTRSMQKQN